MLGHHERKNMAISKSGLPTKVLELFDPREELPFMAPIVKKKPALGMLGIAPFVGHFPDPDDPEYEPAKSEIGSREDRLYRNKEYAAQVSIEVESIRERRELKARAKAEREQQRLEAALAAYDPKADPKATGDPMKTLFVSRIKYDVDEEQLRAAFVEFGPIVHVNLVRDTKGKSRGYAFIEFEHQGDMKSAYKSLPAGKKINDMRVCVDVERGRTVPDWRPRRLGGGKGGEGRVGKEKRDKAAPALAGPPPPASRSGDFGPPRDHAPPRDYAPRDYGDRDRSRRDDRGRDQGRDRHRENGDLPPPPMRGDDRPRDRDRDRDRERDRYRDDDRKRERGRYDDDRDYKRSRMDYDRDRRR